MIGMLIILTLGAGDNGVTAGCASPRDVVAGWLQALPVGGEDPVAAARCIALPPDMTPEQGRTAVVELKRVADARGVLFRLDVIPDSPDYKDPRTGEPRFLPSSQLPDLEIVQTRQGWAFSPSTLRAARRLHDETFVFDLQTLARGLPSWMTRPIFGVAGWQVAAVVILVLLGMVVRLLVASFALAWLRRLMPRFGFHWSEEVLMPASKPLGLLALAGVVALGMPLIGLPAGLAVIVGLAVRTAAASSVVLVIYRLIDVLAESMLERARQTQTKLDDQLVPLVRRFAKITTVAVGAVFVLQNLQVDVASLVAGLGLGGLAFALAAKDTISHLFGSITVFLDKPFQIGDWVNTCGIEGAVEEVGFRSTRVRTFRDTLVTIPNGKLTDAIVDNFGMRRYRRCHVTLNLTYATTPEQMEAFCAGVRGIILAHPQTRKEGYDVAFTAFGAASLDVMVSFFWTVATWSEEQRARHEVFLDIWRLARDLSVQFAFPTQTLHIETVASPTPLDGHRAPPLPTLQEVIARFGPGGAAVVPPGPRIEPAFLPPSPAPQRPEPSRPPT
jgi:MscS family membrane protein